MTTEKETLKQVKLTKQTNEIVLDIISTRLLNNNPVTSKQGVVHDAIAALHKKECK